MEENQESEGSGSGFFHKMSEPDRKNLFSYFSWSRIPQNSLNFPKTTTNFYIFSFFSFNDLVLRNVFLYLVVEEIQRFQ